MKCSTVNAARCEDSSTSQQVLRDITIQFTLEESRALLLRPASFYPLSEDHTVLYKGDNGGPLIAVVSYKTDGVWIWLGLYEWPSDVELTKFRERYLRIV